MRREWVQQTADEARAHPLYGVGGWLALFLLLVLMFVVRELHNARLALPGFRLSDLIGEKPPIVLYVIAVLVIEGAMVLGLFVAALDKAPRFRFSAIVFLVARWPATVVAAFYYGVQDEVMQAQQFVADLGHWMASIIVWGTYFQRSRRVRVTFEHRVLAKELSSAARDAEAENDAAGRARRASAGPGHR